MLKNANAYYIVRNELVDTTLGIFTKKSGLDQVIRDYYTVTGETRLNRKGHEDLEKRVASLRKTDRDILLCVQTVVKWGFLVYDLSAPADIGEEALVCAKRAIIGALRTLKYNGIEALGKSIKKTTEFLLEFSFKRSFLPETPYEAWWWDLTKGTLMLSFLSAKDKMEITKQYEYVYRISRYLERLSRSTENLNATAITDYFKFEEKLAQRESESSLYTYCIKHGRYYRNDQEWAKRGQGVITGLKVTQEEFERKGKIFHMLRQEMSAIYGKKMPKEFPKWFEPKFGTGACAEWRSSKPGAFLKSLTATLSARQSVILGKYGLKFPNYLNECIRKNKREKVTIRGSVVPKNILVKRTIGMEPSGTMLVQQGLLAAFLRLTKHRTIADHVSLEDQTKSSKMALEGSRTGLLGTYDYSAASDSITLNQVNALCPSWVAELLECGRTETATFTLENRSKTISLRKYAAMGSALCFWVEVTMFYSIVQVARKLCADEVPMSETSQFRVYGDDVVAHPALFKAIEEISEFLGYRLNKTKTFVNPGSDTFCFREACGMEALNGVAITAMRVSRKADVSALLIHDSRSVSRLIQEINAALGYTFLQKYLLGVMAHTAVITNVDGEGRYYDNLLTLIPFVPATGEPGYGIQIFDTPENKHLIRCGKSPRGFELLEFDGLRVRKHQGGVSYEIDVYYAYCETCERSERAPMEYTEFMELWIEFRRAQSERIEDQHKWHETNVVAEERIPVPPSDVAAWINSTWPIVRRTTYAPELPEQLFVGKRDLS